MRLVLEKMRNRRYLNQKELSIKSGVPQPMISQIEVGITKYPRKAAGFNIDGSIAIAAIEKAVRDLNLFKDIPDDEPDGQEEPVEVVDPLGTDGVKLDKILYSDDKPIVTIKTSPAVIGSDYITTAGSPTITAENTVTAADHADATTQTVAPAPEAHPPEPSENE